MTESAATNASIVMEEPSITHALKAKGIGTSVAEVTMARMPVWARREIAVPSVLYGDTCMQVAGPPLPPAAQKLMAFLATIFIMRSCPEDRSVEFSLNEAAKAIGYKGNGGAENNRLRKLLIALRAATFETRVRLDGKIIELVDWGLLDEVKTNLLGYRKARVTLSENTAKLLRAESVIWLRTETWHSISSADDLAGVLWVFLEGERLQSREYSYRLFPDSRKGERPPIADILNLTHWKGSRQVVARVKQALGVIVKEDPRYSLRITKSVSMPGQWFLRAQRSEQAKEVAPARTSGLPEAVTLAWRRAYRYRQPSKRQIVVLDEILSRWTVPEICLILAETGPEDPLARLLSRDRARSLDRLAAEGARERAWNAAKAREQQQRWTPPGQILRRIVDPKHVANAERSGLPNTCLSGDADMSIPRRRHVYPETLSSSKQPPPSSLPSSIRRILASESPPMQTEGADHARVS